MSRGCSPPATRGPSPARGQRRRSWTPRASVIKNGLSVRRTEELVKKLNAPAPEAPRAEEVLRVDYVKEVTRRLESTLGRKVKLTEGPNSRGRITLEYYGADDREALISALRR